MPWVCPMLLIGLSKGIFAHIVVVFSWWFFSLMMAFIFHGIFSY